MPTKIVTDATLLPSGRTLGSLLAEPVLKPRLTPKEGPFGPPRIAPRPFEPMTLRVLDIERFRSDLHAELGACTVGYAMGVWVNNRPVAENRWNWARTPADGKVGFLLDVPMHIASCSKFFTGVALMRALNLRGVSVDAAIADYLPSYWAIHNSVRAITFRQLLTHRSGFTENVNGVEMGDGAISLYSSLKGLAEQGVVLRLNGAPQPGELGGYLYNNGNFGMMRVLIPVLTGEIDVDDVFIHQSGQSDVSDIVWDERTAYSYRDHMQGRIFGISGAHAYTDSGRVPGNRSARGYRDIDHDEGGDDYGDMTREAGGDGWLVAVADMLKTLGTIRHTSKIIDAATLRQMTDGQFGCWASDVGGHRVFEHGGAWTGNGGVRAHFVMAPNGVTIVVLANTILPNAASNGSDLWAMIRRCYEGALTLRRGIVIRDWPRRQSVLSDRLAELRNR